MDRALADRWFLGHGDLLAFVKQRNRFARRGAPAAPRDERTARLESAIERAQGSCPEWAATLQAAARGLDRGGLDRDVVDRVLVDVVPERRALDVEAEPRAPHVRMSTVRYTRAVAWWNVRGPGIATALGGAFADSQNRE